MHIITTNFFVFSLPRVLFLTCSLIAGIIIQSTSHSTTLTSIIGFMAVSVSVLFCYHKKYVYGALCAVAFTFFCTGTTLYTHQINKQKNFYSTLHNQQITLTGTIQNIVHEHDYPKKTKLTVSIDTLHNKLKSASLFVYTSFLPNFEINDVVTIEDVTFKNNVSDDFAKYLIKENIDATVFVKKEQVKLIQRPAYSFWRWLAQQKNYCMQTLQAKMSPRSFSFFSSLFLGDKKTNKKEMTFIKHDFRKWGISHYLARSGLHMIIFIGVWQFIFIFLPIGFLYKELILLLLALCYAMLTTPSISFNRALLAFFIYKACTISGKQSHALTIISLVTLLILLYNPISLFFLDFQLSFGLAFLLAWLNQIRLQKRIATLSTINQKQ